jgi:hypothetical protein
MKTTPKEIYDKLHPIYQKYRNKYKGNSDSQKMCLMWSTYNPPDIIEGTKPFRDIEKVFNIEINETECMEIYDMTITEATVRLASLIDHQC